MERIKLLIPGQADFSTALIVENLISLDQFVAFLVALYLKLLTFCVFLMVTRILIEIKLILMYDRKDFFFQFFFVFEVISFSIRSTLK
jgi:hypothetical protein